MVTDHLNGGTYNWGVVKEGDAWSYVKHFALDVFPYWLFGDGSDAPTNFFERLFGGYDPKYKNDVKEVEKC